MKPGKCRAFRGGRGNLDFSDSNEPATRLGRDKSDRPPGQRRKTDLASLTFLILALLSTLLIGFVFGVEGASPDAGKVVETGFQFEHIPKRLVYFKDSEVCFGFRVYDIPIFPN